MLRRISKADIKQISFAVASRGQVLCPDLAQPNDAGAGAQSGQ